MSENNILEVGTVKMAALSGYVGAGSHEIVSLVVEGVIMWVT